MGTGVRVEGLDRAVRDLQNAGVEISDLKEVFAGIAAEGARLASSFAPKRTGRLAGSIRGNKAKNKAVILAGKARVPYAGAINYGWPRRNIRPAMFLAKADQQLAGRAVAMLEAGLDAAVKKAGF